VQHKSIVDVPATKREVVARVTCDLCNAEIKNYSNVVNEVTVSSRQGDSWPSGGSGQTEFVDMCKDCFQSKLKAWLQSQGVKLQRSDWDY
jgi:hypothetical protein